MKSIKMLHKLMKLNKSDYFNLTLIFQHLKHLTHTHDIYDHIEMVSVSGSLDS